MTTWVFLKQNQAGSNYNSWKRWLVQEVCLLSAIVDHVLFLTIRVERSHQKFFFNNRFSPYNRRGLIGRLAMDSHRLWGQIEY